VGERHRFRLINIAPAGRASAFIMKGEASVPIRLLAKDGADLPASQQVEAQQVPRIGVGSTADFTWTPSEPGEYVLTVGFPNTPILIRQTWTVTGSDGDGARGGR
jgi:hypothetical protein